MIKFKSASELLPSLSFKITYSEETEFDVKNDRNEKSSWNKAGTLSVKNALVGAKISPDRGIGFTSFKVWDSNLVVKKKEPIEVDINKIGNKTYRLTKKIPAAFAVGATFPVYTDTISSFYPDANVETNTVDGIVLHISDGSTFATIQGAVGSAAVDDGTNNDALVMETGTATEWRKIHRAILLFDTSLIGDSDTVASSTMSIRATAADDTNGVTAAHKVVHIVSSAPASDTALASGDYDSLGTTDYGSVAFASISTTAYTPIVLTSDGRGAISKTGVTKFGLRYAVDKDAGSPARNGNSLTTTVAMDFADQAGAGTDPYLSVDYTAAAGAGANDDAPAAAGAFFFLF